MLYRIACEHQYCLHALDSEPHSMRWSSSGQLILYVRWGYELVLEVQNCLITVSRVLRWRGGFMSGKRGYPKSPVTLRWMTHVLRGLMIAHCNTGTNEKRYGFRDTLSGQRRVAWSEDQERHNGRPIVLTRISYFVCIVYRLCTKNKVAISSKNVSSTNN